MKEKTVTSNGSSQANVLNKGNRVLKLGLGYTVAMQEDGGRIKATGRMRHADFLNWVHKKLEESWEIYSCHEAGASGYWSHSDEMIFLLPRSPLAWPSCLKKRRRTVSSVYRGDPLIASSIL
jgi:hypothetical protein